MFSPENVMMSNSMHEIVGDKYRLSPLILFARSLILTGEIGTHIDRIAVDVVMLESVVRRNGVWGRYVLYVDADFVSMFRYAIVYGNCDSTTKDMIAGIHILVNSFQKSVESTGLSVQYVWQAAAVPGHAFYELCCTEDEVRFMRDMLDRDEPTPEGLELAHLFDDSYGEIVTIAGVVTGRFPVWDTSEYPSWYYSADAPYARSYPSGYCYHRLLYKPVYQDVGKWPKVSSVRALPCNPFMRCSPTGSGKWHVPSPTSAWVPGLKCFKDLPRGVRIGGDDFLISVPGSMSSLPSVTEICQMSIALAKFYEFSPSGVSFRNVRDGLHPAEPPFTSYLIGFPIRRRGYVIYPIAVASVSSRISCHLQFSAVPVAAYFVGDGKHYSLEVSASTITFSYASDSTGFVMVLFPDSFDYADVADFLAADVQRLILSKL